MAGTGGRAARRASQRVVAIAVAVLVLAALLVLTGGSPAAGAAGPAGTTTTVTSFATDCEWDADGEVTRRSQPLTHEVTAPNDVGRGDRFTVRIAPGPMVLPFQEGGTRLYGLTNLWFSYELPASVEYVQGSVVPGTGSGFEGQPDVGFGDSPEGSRASLHVNRVPADPTGPEAGTPFQPPAFDLELTAVGDLGDTIEVRVAGLDRANTSYGFRPQADVPIIVQCWPAPIEPGLPLRRPVPAPVMSSTRIVDSTAAPVPTETTLSATSYRAAPGVPIRLRADVRTPSWATVVGDVEFRDTTGGTVLGRAPLRRGTAELWAALSGSPGDRRVTAHYLGIPGQSPSTSAAITVWVDELSRQQPSLSLSLGSELVVEAGTTHQVRAAVGPGGGWGVPTGRVTFWDNGNLLGSSSLGSGSLEPTASIDVSLAGVAGHIITAEYEGDVDFHGSVATLGVTSGGLAAPRGPAVTGTIRLNGMDAELTNPLFSTTYLSKFGASPQGELVLDGAFAFGMMTYVSGPAGAAMLRLNQVGPATGRIAPDGAATLTTALHVQVDTFTGQGPDWESYSGSCWLEPFDVSLSGNRVDDEVVLSATGFEVSAPAPRACRDTAGVDRSSLVDDLLTGQDSALSVRFRVPPQPPTTTSLALVPSGPTPYGQPVRAVATVTSPDGLPLPIGGTVEIWDGGVRLPTDGPVRVDRATGLATAVFSEEGAGALRVGAHQLVARFLPDDPLLLSPSASNPSTHVVRTPTPQVVTLAVTADPPSGAPLGQEVAFDVQVTPAPSADSQRPNRVVLAAGGTAVATGDLDGTGRATLFGQPPAGSTSLTASFTPADPWAFQAAVTSLPYEVTGQVVDTHIAVVLPEGHSAYAGTEPVVEAHVTPGARGTVAIFVDGLPLPLSDQGRIPDLATGRVRTTFPAGDQERSRSIRAEFTPTTPMATTAWSPVATMAVIWPADAQAVVGLTISPPGPIVAPAVLHATATVTATGPAQQVKGRVRLTRGGAWVGEERVVGGVANFELRPPPGTGDYRAAFISDAYWLGSGTSPVVTRVVLPTPTNIPTITNLEVGPASPAYEAALVSLVATVIPADPNIAVAIGTVELFDGPTRLGTLQMWGGSRQVEMVIPGLPVGDHRLRAVFTPMSPEAFQPSSSPSLEYSVVVPVDAPTTTAIGVDVPSTVIGGSAEPLTLTATVDAGAAGKLVFRDGATVLGESPAWPKPGTRSEGTITVPEGLHIGRHTITAAFVPDDPAQFRASTSPPFSLEVVAAAQPTTTMLTASPASPSVVGAPITLTAAVPTGGAGVVDFLRGGAYLGTAEVVDGAAHLVIEDLALGNHELRANFFPLSPAFTPSGSPPLAHRVKVPGIATSTALVVSPAGPTVSGVEVTLDATVSPAGAVGSVELLDGATVIGTQPVAAGTASLATSALSVGTHRLSARFVPTDDAYDPSTSPTVTHEVSAPPATATSTGLVVSPAGPTVSGVEVTLDAMVSPAGAVGSVEFLDGATVIGTRPVAGGVASLATSALLVGTHRLSARFVPVDPGVFLGSVSSVVDHVVSGVEPVVPGAPTGVVAVGGALQATVSWTAPVDDGGSPIVGYDVRGLGGAVLVSTSADVTSVAVIGLGVQDGITFTVLARNAVGSSGSSEASNPVDISAADKVFSDVPVGHVFHDEINWAIVEGITVGYEGGEFRPGNAVSRQAMAAFLYRFAGEPAFTAPEVPSFSDVPVWNPFYLEIEWLSATGITTGSQGGLFKPAEVVSRQAMAAFLYRFAGEPAFTAPEVPSFSDVPVWNPFYLEVEWLSATGITTGSQGGLFKPAAAVSRQSMVTFMYRYTTQAIPVAPPIPVG